MGNDLEIETRKKEPSIRTMKLDVSEFLKTSKPSLTSILSGQAQWEGYHSSETKLIPLKIAVAAVGIGIVVAGAALIYFRWSSDQKTGSAVPDQSLVSPALIFFEDTKEVNAGKTRQELMSALEDVGRLKGRIGSLDRLIIRTTTEAGIKSIVKLDEFFKLAGAGEEPAFSKNINAVPQFFVYYRNPNPSFGMLIEAANPPRALRDLLADESALQQGLEPMFLGSPPPSVLEPFKDITYKNTDFRYLDMDPARGFGIGYLYFPAKKIIAVTTSMEATRLVIDRLFENN